jgi:hypothetical protein
MEPQTIHYGEHALRKHTCNVNPFEITTQVPYILQSPAAAPDMPKSISLCTYICENISSGFLHLNNLEAQTLILLTWRIWWAPINAGRWDLTQRLLTYLLTPWSAVLLEKLRVNFAASQEIFRIYGTRKFLTVPTSARHLSLSWANSIQSPRPTPTS